MKEISNEVPRKLAVNSNDSLVISVKEHIKSLQNGIYFLREAIQQKNALISIILQKKIYIYIYIYIYINMRFPTLQNMRITYRIKKQLLNMKEIHLNYKARSLK